MTILFPSDPASLTVLGALLLTVGYWLWMLYTVGMRVRRERQVIQQLAQPEAVDLMREYRQRATTKSAAEDYIDRLAEEVSVPSSSLTVRHVHSILKAGIEGARLEIRQRLSNVVNQIFRENARLKAVLSIFIVIGLLGTLYGLGEALATLSANDLLNFEPSIVRTLLGRLETALAPSIWGVFFTIGGVLLYGYFLNSVCQPVKTDLEQATIEHWVPALYPTESQRTEETLTEAREQLQNNVEAAERVAEFAERVDEDLQDFDRRIESAKGLIQHFGTSLEKLKEISEDFQQTMAEFGDFQEQLTTMYARIEERQESLNALLEGLEERDQELQSRLGDLEKLEQAWQEHLIETQDQLQNVTDAAQDALEGLNERNEAIIREVGEPITESLEVVSERLSNVDQSMHEGLREIRQGLDRVRNPVTESADRIERIADTFTDNLRNTVSGVKGEFQRQNDVQADRAEELSRLNDNIETLVQEQKALREALQKYSPSRNGTGLLGRVQDYFEGKA